MFNRKMLLLFAIVFFVGLAGTLLIIVRSSAARYQTSLTILNHRGNTSCGEQTAPIVVPGDTIGFDMRGFHKQDPVTVNVILPDGRIFKLDEMNGTRTLTTTEMRTDDGGSFYMEYATTSGTEAEAEVDWPLGCYTLVAQGKESKTVAKAAMAVLNSEDAIATAEYTKTATLSGALLHVVDHETGQSQAAQTDKVDMFGIGFASNETVSLEVTMPDGTTQNLPSQQTSIIGEFQYTTALTFTDPLPAGIYTFTAVGKTSDYSTTSTFAIMQPTQGKTSWSAVRVIEFPMQADALTKTVQVQGRRFRPGEVVVVTMTQTSAMTQTNAMTQTSAMTQTNAAQPFTATQFAEADTSGNFAVTFAVTRALQAYTVTAQGSESGSSAEATIEASDSEQMPTVEPTTPTKPTMTPTSPITTTPTTTVMATPKVTTTVTATPTISTTVMATVAPTNTSRVITPTLKPLILATTPTPTDMDTTGATSDDDADTTASGATQKPKVLFVW